MTQKVYWCSFLGFFFFYLLRYCSFWYETLDQHCVELFLLSIVVIQFKSEPHVMNWTLVLFLFVVKVNITLFYPTWIKQWIMLVCVFFHSHLVSVQFKLLYFPWGTLFVQRINKTNTTVTIIAQMHDKLSTMCSHDT